MSSQKKLKAHIRLLEQDLKDLLITLENQERLKKRLKKEREKNKERKVAIKKIFEAAQEKSENLSDLIIKEFGSLI